MNARALVGVAHTNTLILVLREPLQRGPGSTSPPLTQFTFPSASIFAASFGGSVDYRLTDRLSYRIVQPELLLTRSTTGGASPWTQTNFRLSSGIVFTSGKSPGNSSGLGFSFGVVGGAALTDAFGHETTGFLFTENRGLQPVRSRSITP